MAIIGNKHVSVELFALNPDQKRYNNPFEDNPVFDRKLFFSRFDSKLVFWTWKFCSNESAKFEKNQQAVLALSFQLKKTAA